LPRRHLPRGVPEPVLGCLGARGARGGGTSGPRPASSRVARPAVPDPPPRRRRPGAGACRPRWTVPRGVAVAGGAGTPPIDPRGAGARLPRGPRRPGSPGPGTGGRGAPRGVERRGDPLGVTERRSGAGGGGEREAAGRRPGV